MNQNQLMELQKLTLESLRAFNCDQCGSNKGEYIHEIESKDHIQIKVRCTECGYTIKI